MDHHRSRYERHQRFIYLELPTFDGRMVTFIRNCCGHVYSGRTSIISSGKALHLELRPMMLQLAMVFVASDGDCFCSVRYSGCGSKVRVQKDSSDTRFTPKMDILKQTILNTPYIKTLKIFPSARESLSVQTSTSRSVKNQCCLQCS